MAPIGVAISMNACARARPPRLCEGAMCFAAKSPRFSRQPRASWLVTATEKDRVGRSGCGRGRCDRMSLLRLLTARCTKIRANSLDLSLRRCIPALTSACSRRRLLVGRTAQLPAAYPPQPHSSTSRARAPSLVDRIAALLTQGTGTRRREQAPAMLA